ncbi:hypothetical protein Q7Z91_004561 [Salmonella enterica]|nr:hypothetical protein [Salmonella enterica]ELI4993806.1 hypothetical protein [Salmonella enterica]
MEFNQGKREYILNLLDKSVYFERILNSADVMNEIREVYINHKITANKETEYKLYTQQFAKRNAYLSALKKTLKRKIVKQFADDIVDIFEIQETTISFFMNLCSEIMNRKVDNKFVILHFANRVKIDNRFEKLKEKRTAKNKLKLKYSYEEMTSLSFLYSIEDEFRKQNFKECFLQIVKNMETYFSIIKEESKDEKKLLIEYEKGKIEKVFSENKENVEDKIKTRL